MCKKYFLGFLSITAIAFSIFFVNPASAKDGSEDRVQSPAATFLIEDFTASVGTAITTVGWTAHSSGGTNTIVTSAPGLTLTGYPSSGVGNAVSLATSGEDVNRGFAIQTSGSVYAAFMVNTSEASTDAAGGYFFHLGPDPVGTTFRGRVFIKKDASNNVAFGISKAATAAADIAFTPFAYSLNTTYLVVVKYTIVDGATNDTVALFVSSNVPATEPSPTATATDVTATDVNPGTVSLRQGTATTSPTVRVDGIRVGNDWASVTQPVAPSDAPVDFNGDGKTDWVVARDIGGGQLRWFWNINGSAAPTLASDWGLFSDTIVPADYDGDQKDDIAVWRPGAPLVAAFYILQSATSTVRIEQFGQSGDDATVVNDYNGDGKDDVAVFRSGEGTWFYRTTPNGAVTYVLWGQFTDVPAPGDWNGDGTADFGIFRVNGQTRNFWIRLSNGTVQPVVTFGVTSDAAVTGDFDGDGKTDHAVVRSEGFVVKWHWRPSGGGADQQTTFGLPGDIPAPGDYDGDGKTDVAVFRNGVFYARSTASGAVSIFTLGAPPDRVPANYNVH